MPNFWDYRILDNALRAYIIVVATILFVIVLKRFISRLIGRLIFRFVSRMGPGLGRFSQAGRGADRDLPGRAGIDVFDRKAAFSVGAGLRYL